MFFQKTMKKLLASIKNTIKKSSYGERLFYVSSFNQEVIDEFIIGVVRKEVKSGSKIRLDKYGLDDYDPLTKFTIGYLVKARKI